MSSSLLLRLTEYNSKVLLTNGQMDGNIVAFSTAVAPNSNQFFRNMSYSTDVA